MSGRRPHVGHIQLAKRRWQVFNDNYDVAEDGERRDRSDAANYDLPWALVGHHRTYNKYFRTQAEALAYVLPAKSVDA